MATMALWDVYGLKAMWGVIESGMYDSGMIIPIVPVKW